MSKRANCYRGATSTIALTAALLCGTHYQADAADECGSAGGGTVTCGDGIYAGGISYTVVPVTGFTLNLDGPGIVVPSTAPSGVGISGAATGAFILNATRLTSITRLGTIALSVTNSSSGSSVINIDSGSITGNIGGTWGGVYATSTSGAARINLNGGAVSANNAGNVVLRAKTTSGSASILMTGGSVTGTRGLLADTFFGGTGSASVDITGGTVTTTGDGASSVTFSGNATTGMSGGSVTSGGNGLVATSGTATTAGNASVIMEDGSVLSTGASSSGILARSTVGQARVEISGGTVTAASGAAVLSQSDTHNADITVTGGTVEVQSGTNPALSAVVSNAAGTGRASVSISGSATVIGARGATATNGGAGVAQITMEDGNLTASTFGLSATTAGVGAAQIAITGGSIATSTSYGARAAANGSGNATISMSGGSIAAGTGASSFGIHALSGGGGAAHASFNGGSIATRSSLGVGVFAQAGLTGTGPATAIMTDGTVTTANGVSNGVRAQIANTASTADTTVMMTGGAITLNGPLSAGLYSFNQGTGQAIVQMSGGSVTATGDRGEGIFANVGSATGTYNVNISGGTVTAGSGFGAGIHTVAAAGGTITIGTGATIDGGASGVAIRDGDLNRDGVDEIGGNVAITTAGTLTGDVILGGGNDTIIINGGSIAGDIAGDSADSLTFDLGAGSFTYGAAYAISGMDSAIMTSGTALIDGTLTADTLAVNGGKLNLNGVSTIPGGATISGGTLAVGDATHASALLTGNLDVLAGGRLQGIGTVVGSLASAGTIAPGNSIGTLTIDGDYVGSGGTLEVETVLGDDASPTDLLVISGGTSGSTNVQVVNLGGAGAQTVEGIKIVDVGGASNGAFALQGDYVYQGDQATVAGAYAYRLYKNGVSDPADGDWYLRSALISPDEPAPGPGPGPGPSEPTPLYQAGVPIYEAYAGALQTFNQLGTLQQRLGNRHWTVVAQGADGISNEMTVSPGIGMWGEIEGARAEFNPESTTGAQYDTTIWRLKAGFDTSLYEGAAGNFIGGVAVHYGTVSADVSSIYGSGSIDTKGYGLSGMLTWYGNDGWYVDSQAQATWYDSDLFSETAGIGLTEGNNGFGYALGIEVGKRIPIDPEWAITPQAQLAWSSVDFDDFADPFGAGVALGSGDSLIGRLGLAIDRQTEWRDAAGNISRAHIYGIANLYYDFKDGSTVDVAGTPIRSENDGLWGGLGMGGTVDWAEGKYSLYGEVMARTGLKDFGDSHVFTGTVGFRMKW